MKAQAKNKQKIVPSKNFKRELDKAKKSIYYNKIIKLKKNLAILWANTHL